ncbi:ribose 5-phosphate isomerase B [Anaerosolibacter carboniphilus]|uniref:Ribose 5-phosphate isomerase B n=1 Tax=Anaerosolibacter carboniphilus TaxID=1417629 RepID=A0A841KZH1_9FIRM|nr:ribose 5-phosphate isomerase B [Anaerosolibacter carboniphilus]MBB6217370.1 ribose 5-phosphate isomerase B [Anaerosolibacter carboniphilus]
MRIAIGCDQNAYALKTIIINHLKKVDVEFADFGCHEGEEVLYPDVAHTVAKEIANGKYDRGILLCGTGLGMAITANKVPGIRAATCHDVFSAERAIKSNDAQIITMGAQVIGPELAKMLIDAWLASEFQGGRSKPKVDLINEIDGIYHQK